MSASGCEVQFAQQELPAATPLGLSGGVPPAAIRSQGVLVPDKEKVERVVREDVSPIEFDARVTSANETAFKFESIKEVVVAIVAAVVEIFYPSVSSLQP
ncbi:hypothetical protein N7462_005275 [Penicillium macrosclerotiorum]|uniref:uncharacterized protein n=1 Tax=Penicillium macrosclerotiorum TaxID=303699 RepID=UPI0025471DB5|nr:uncharacterized protein N7462_005275 [Penicillium macrosclerotiorum]KAJ5690883.1 hypothetical protein N7462_005275 [Penicillium macrosclerotiorum]